MKLPKGLIFVVLAGLAGLVAVFAINRYITAKTHVVEKPTGQVVVAASEISPGMALTPGMLKIVNYPAESVPATAIRSTGELNERVASIKIEKGEAILPSKLAPKGTPAGLVGTLKENKRAFTVRVDDVSGVAGFIYPGNRVDVLMDLQIPNCSEHFSKIILEDVEVLTTGQIWEPNKDNKPVIVNTVTLGLEPDQAEKLNLASNTGKIRLTLRGPNNKNTQTPGVATGQLITANFRPNQDNKEKAKEPQLKVAKGPKKRAVEVIKGVERTNATL